MRWLQLQLVVLTIALVCANAACLVLCAATPSVRPHCHQHSHAKSDCTANAFIYHCINRGAPALPVLAARHATLAEDSAGFRGRPESPHRPPGILRTTVLKIQVGQALSPAKLRTT